MELNFLCWMCVSHFAPLYGLSGLDVDHEVQDVLGAFGRRDERGPCCFGGPSVLEVRLLSYLTVKPHRQSTQVHTSHAHPPINVLA